MRFDMAMRVPFSLFAFALVRLALVRAVAFNRPYTRHAIGGLTDLRFRVGVWSGMRLDEARPGELRTPAARSRDGPRFRL